MGIVEVITFTPSLHWENSSSITIAQKAEVGQPDGESKKSPGPALNQYLKVPFLQFDAAVSWIRMAERVDFGNGDVIFALDADRRNRSRWPSNSQMYL